MSCAYRKVSVDMVTIMLKLIVILFILNGIDLSTPKCRVLTVRYVRCHARVTW